MKTVKRLDIKDKPGYFCMNMTNINDFDPKLLMINEFKIFEHGSIMFDISYCKENNRAHIVFNNVECIFRENGVFRKKVQKLKKTKNKKILDKYMRIIDEIKEEILFIIEDDLFVTGKDFTGFKFKTDVNLVYNQKINVPVCVISISSVFKERNWYYPQVELQDCFYESSKK